MITISDTSTSTQASLKAVAEGRKHKDMKHLVLRDVDKDLLMMLHDFIYLDLEFIHAHVYKNYQRFTSVRSRLYKLEEAGYIKMFSSVETPTPPHYLGSVVTLSETGASIIEELQGYGRWNRAWTRKLPIWYRHTLLLARAVIHYMNVENERYRFVDFIPEARSYFKYGSTQSDVIRPDGLMVISIADMDGDETIIGIFLEMERSNSKRYSIQNKIKQYEGFLGGLDTTEKYQAEKVPEEPIDHWAVLFISTTEKEAAVLKRKLDYINPAVGERPSKVRPGMNMNVFLTSIDKISENPLGDIYYEMAKVPNDSPGKLNIDFELYPGYSDSEE